MRAAKITIIPVLSLAAALVLAGALLLAGCSSKGGPDPAISGPELTAEQHREVAEANLRAGELDTALAHYDRAAAKDADDMLSRVRVGEILLAKGDEDRALAAFRLVLKIDPANAGANMGAGKVYFRTGLNEEAKAHFEQALAADPGLWTCRNYLGVIHSRLGDHGTAMEHYRRALAMRPGEAAVLNNMGLTQAMSGDHQGAVKTLSRVAAANAAGPRTFNNLGMALARLGRYDEALETFKKAGDEAKAHNNLGYALLMNGKPAEAAAHFETAIQLSPTYYVTAANNLTKARRAAQFDLGASNSGGAVIRPASILDQGASAEALSLSNSLDVRPASFQDAGTMRPDSPVIEPVLPEDHAAPVETAQIERVPESVEKPVVRVESSPEVLETLAGWKEEATEIEAKDAEDEVESASAVATAENPAPAVAGDDSEASVVARLVRTRKLVDGKVVSTSSRAEPLSDEKGALKEGTAAPTRDESPEKTAAKAVDERAEKAVAKVGNEPLPENAMLVVRGDDVEIRKAPKNRLVKVRPVKREDPEGVRRAVDRIEREVSAKAPEKAPQPEAVAQRAEPAPEKPAQKAEPAEKPRAVAKKPLFEPIPGTVPNEGDDNDPLTAKRYGILVASFRDMDAAAGARDQLADKGFDARIVAKHLDGGTVWLRVVAGRFGSIAEAKEHRAEYARRLGLEDSALISRYFLPAAEVAEGPGS